MFLVCQFWKWWSHKDKVLHSRGNHSVRSSIWREVVQKIVFDFIKCSIWPVIFRSMTAIFMVMYRQLVHFWIKMFVRACYTTTCGIFLLNKSIPVKHFTCQVLDEIEFDKLQVFCYRFSFQILHNKVFWDRNRYKLSHNKADSFFMDPFVDLPELNTPLNFLFFLTNSVGSHHCNDVVVYSTVQKCKNTHFFLFYVQLDRFCCNSFKWSWATVLQTFWRSF